MRLNPRLFHKLVIIGLIPLALEVVLAGTLFKMVADAETQARHEREARQASADLNDLYQRITAAAQLVGSLMLKQSDVGDAAQFNAQQQTITGDLRNIRELIAADPSMVKQVDELEDNINASMRVIEDALGDVQSGSRMMALNKLRYLRSTIPVITVKLNALRAHFDRTADDHFYTQEQGRKTMQTLLTIGIIFNLIVVIGFGLVILIERDLTSRLKVVVENTGRLANDQQLLPSVGGADEIAHVDRVFREMATALRSAREKERAIERLKQEFAAMISHDLRTPLTSIQLFVSMLSRGMFGEVNEKIKDKAAMADRNATRLIGLINDLLDLEKMEAGQLPLACSKSDVDRVVNRSLESVRDFADKQDVRIEFNTSNGLSVFADEGRVIQVLVNLLSNAIKFSPKGGVVSVVVTSDGTAAKLAVRDQGRGVPEDLQEAVFDRFKQVDASDATEKKGTGLGLAICKAIVEQHGGSIGLESAVGVGSTFWFTLPLATVEVAEEIAIAK